MEDQKYKINWFYNISIENINKTIGELLDFRRNEEAFIYQRHLDIYNSIFDIESISKFKGIPDFNLYKKTVLEELAATIENYQFKKNALVPDDIDIDIEMVLDSAITLTVAIRMHNTTLSIYRVYKTGGDK